MITFRSLLATVLLGAAGPGASLLAQQPLGCDALRQQLYAAAASPDSVVVYATLSSASRGVTLPRWYLQAALTEIVSRFNAADVRYDPLLDVSLPLRVARTGGATATARLTEREVIVQSLGPQIKLERRTRIEVIGAGPNQVHIADVPPGPPDGGAMMDSVRLMKQLSGELMAARPFHAAPELFADPASVTMRLAAAVTLASAAGALPPLPDDVGDSVSLTLRLRPALSPEPASPDSGAGVLAAFRVSGLHAGRAQYALYDGEVDVAAEVEAGDRPPAWPAGGRDKQGGALLQLVVDTTGRVDASTLRVLEAVPGFDQPALDAVRRWRYHPASVRGCPVRAIVNQAFLFVP
jgi:TonB family protein